MDANSIEMPNTAYGVARLASDDDIVRDEHGYTHPNLHRRIDESAPPEGSLETDPRSYTLGVYDRLHSLRRTDISYHNEETSTDDIP